MHAPSPNRRAGLRRLAALSPLALLFATCSRRARRRRPWRGPRCPRPRSPRPRSRAARPSRSRPARAPPPHHRARPQRQPRAAAPARAHPRHRPAADVVVELPARVRVGARHVRELGAGRAPGAVGRVPGRLRPRLRDRRDRLARAQQLEFDTMAWSAGTHGPVRAPAVLSLHARGARGAPRLVRRGLGGRAALEARRDPRPRPAARRRRGGREGRAGGLGAGLRRQRAAAHLGATTRSTGRSCRACPPRTCAATSRTSWSSASAKGEAVELEFDDPQPFPPRSDPALQRGRRPAGSEQPDEYVIVCGHLDSWDGAKGAVDNGTGCATTLEAARLLVASGARPKRTIRFMLWSGEEQGLLGSRAYVEKHKAELAEASAPCSTTTAARTTCRASAVTHEMEPQTARGLRAGVRPRARHAVRAASPTASRPRRQRPRVLRAGRRAGLLLGPGRALGLRAHATTPSSTPSTPRSPSTSSTRPLVDRARWRSASRTWTSCSTARSMAGPVEPRRMGVIFDGETTRHPPRVAPRARKAARPAGRRATWC